MREHLLGASVTSAFVHRGNVPAQGSRLTERAGSILAPRPPAESDAAVRGAHVGLEWHCSFRTRPLDVSSAFPILVTVSCATQVLRGQGRIPGRGWGLLGHFPSRG